MTVAKIPEQITFEENFDGGNVIFNKTQEDQDIPVEHFTCMAIHVRPAPTFEWMIGMN